MLATLRATLIHHRLRVCPVPFNSTLELLLHQSNVVTFYVSRSMEKELNFLHRWMHALLSGKIIFKMQYQKGKWIVLLLFQHRNNSELHVLLSNATLCKYKDLLLLTLVQMGCKSLRYYSNVGLHFAGRIPTKSVPWRNKILPDYIIVEEAEALEHLCF